MAKRRGTTTGGGSNMGLIITLVIFVLATVILAVTTYIGFAEQAELKKKADDEKAKANTADNKANWYRFQARLLRMFMGRRPALGEQEKVFLDEVQKFQADQLTFSKQEDEKEFKELVAKLEKDMPWAVQTQPEPSPTYEGRLTDNKAKITALEKQLAGTEEARKEAEKGKTDAETVQKNNKKDFEQKIEDLKKTSEKNLQEMLAKQEQAIKNSLDNAGEKEEARKLEATAKADFVKTDKKRADLETKLSAAEKEKRNLQQSLEEARQRLALVAERAGLDPRASGDDTLDLKALELLKTWNRDWKIVALDKTGKFPYINLGSSDGLKPQVTFSIHAVGPDGKLSPNPKGTLEVQQVVGASMAKARITSVHDEKKNPIMKGDRLFNPTFDPFRRKKVAIAGLADMGMDGTDDSADLRRLLERSNVDVDAYISIREEKAPKIIGKGVTVNTDYLILADSLESLNHPKARTPGYTKAFDELQKKMKETAQSNGVQIIPLRRYLDLIGYRQPKAASSK